MFLSAYSEVKKNMVNENYNVTFVSDTHEMNRISYVIRADVFASVRTNTSHRDPGSILMHNP